MVVRVWHGTVALAVVYGLVLQVIITARAPATPPGHAVGTLAGAALITRLVRVVSFFTVQSNILCGIVSAQLARNPRRDDSAWRAVRLAALVGIAVTGVVYSTVLARIHEPKGWEQTINNAIFHYAVPLLVVIGWLLFGPRPRIDPRTILLAAIWPLAWLVYTIVHGEASGWYPYPFVDAATHGYGRVVANLLGVLVVFAVVAALYLLGDRRLPGAPRPLRSARRDQLEDGPRSVH
jgi:hypothetical protein